MFTKTSFKFFLGFLTLVIFGMLGATFSNRYFSGHQDMLAHPEERR